MTVNALCIAQWRGDLSDNKEDIIQCWGLKLQLCMCTLLQCKRREAAKEQSETPVEGFKGTRS